ncbi:hypothetical protein DFAR_40002 [Desulfarculales bacterium]
MREHGAMLRVYARTDVLVLPSRQMDFEKEPSGQVLAEAMASGVVGGDCDAIPEVIGDAGLIYPQGDTPALARCLERLANTQEREALAGARLKRTRELFSW